MRKVLFIAIIFCSCFRAAAQQHLQTVYSSGGNISTNGGYQSICVVGQAAVGLFSASEYSGSFGYLNAEDQLFTEIRDKSIKEKQIFVFPNPSGGSFRVSTPFEEGEIDEVCVLNAIGQRIYNRNSSPLASLTIDLGRAPSGIYWLQFQAGKNLYHKQIIIR
jgi:hypothetical protein